MLFIDNKDSVFCILYAVFVSGLYGYTHVSSPLPVSQMRFARTPSNFCSIWAHVSTNTTISFVYQDLYPPCRLSITTYTPPISFVYQDLYTPPPTHTHTHTLSFFCQATRDPTSDDHSCSLKEGTHPYYFTTSGAKFVH